MKKVSEQVWFITGISRGLGRELARTILGEGGRVIGTSRDGATDLAPANDALHVLPLELTDADQPREVVAAAHALHGRLDVSLTSRTI